MPIFDRLRRWRRCRAAKVQITRLGQQLMLNYGRPEFYTTGQVNVAISDCDFDLDRHVGHALFMSRDDFDALYQGDEKSFNYNDIRQYVADLCFDGDTSFKPKKSRHSSHNPAGRSDGY